MTRMNHYLWAGLDLMVPEAGPPVLLDANKSSHMLGEYLRFHGDERPFELIASRMNEANGPPVILWRQRDPEPHADEDIAFITRHLRPCLREEPRIARVEDNLPESDSTPDDPHIVCDDGERIVAGSLFRWWYGCPWRIERGGTLVINSNALWVACRDKWHASTCLAGASAVRSAWSIPVDSAEEAELALENDSSRFRNGFVLKPRLGWGGYGVQVAAPGERPRRVGPGYLLSERIQPARRAGHTGYWDVRAFVMDGRFVGGLVHHSPDPNTNYWQGGQVAPLSTDLIARIAPAAEEAVYLIEQAAQRIHQQPPALGHPSTIVNYD